MVSAEKLGTVINLDLPAARVKTPIARSTGNGGTAFRGRGEKILVVDDMKEPRELTTALLESLGYSAQAVAGGEEAVDYIKEKPVDLLVLDMIMDPGMDGLETYRRILEINPGQRAIIVSGFSETDRIREAQQLGAGEFVNKPYVLEKFGWAVRRELDRETR